MKLIVQIPCYNEENTLPRTIADIPRTIEGIDSVEILVIDDGSQDRTSAVARELGVEHIIRHRRNRGLASTFRTGLHTALRLGADIIVNTDGDNQYAGGDIPRLVEPILAGRADVTIGDRQIHQISHFSPMKKRLSRLGSAVVRFFSGLDVPDAVSGFRGLSRSAAKKINIVSSFSYTIEMLIQISRKRLALESVPVGTNSKLRESRLFKNIPSFIIYSSVTLMRVYAMVQPFRLFFSLGAFLVLLGAFPFLRFLYFYLFESGAGHIQSLILGAALLMIGALTFMIGLVADLISFNRQLIEISLERQQNMEERIDRLLEDKSSTLPPDGRQNNTAAPSELGPLSRDDQTDPTVNP